MKVVGLITEYNPFHNGHKYHIEEAKRVTGADYVIVVMSGNFVQRGAPAIINKYSRTLMALNNGADLVLEIPVCYATGSAEYFALGSVSLLDKLGVVDYLCFGSECGDINLIIDAARLLIDQNDSIEALLSSYMKEGLSYPIARSHAVEQYLKTSYKGEKQKDITELLLKPNNILGIEYVKALLRLSSTIEPVTIQRQSNNYHDKALSNQPVPSSLLFTSANETQSTGNNTVISSATAIRNSIPEMNIGTQLKEVQNSIPSDVYELLVHNYNKTFPITEEDFAQIIKYKILAEDSKILYRYVDITKDLADRIKNTKHLTLSISELAQAIKTKNVTLTRINRALFHLLLNQYQDNLDAYNENGYVSYARVLGIKTSSSHLLRQIIDLEGIPVITKVSKAEKQLDELGKRMLSEDMFASHLYNQVVYDKFNTVIPNEYQHGVIRV